jgi:hypothetical protein
MLVVQGRKAKESSPFITNDMFVIISQPNTEGFGWALKCKKRAAGHSTPTQDGAALQGQLVVRQFNIGSKSGPQKRAGRNTGTHRGGSSEGKKRKRAAAKAAAVAEH